MYSCNYTYKSVEREKIFANCASNKTLIYRIYKELKQQQQKNKQSDFKMGKRSGCSQQLDDLFPSGHLILLLVVKASVLSLQGGHVAPAWLERAFAQAAGSFPDTLTPTPAIPTSTVTPSPAQQQLGRAFVL
ncbi:hypothetical protein AAY473_034586 [Plecturocebus cupreus]